MEIKNPFAKNFTKDLVLNCKYNRLKKIENLKEYNKNTFDLYWMANEYLKKGDFKKALKLFLTIKDSGINSENLEEKIKISNFCLS